MEKTRTHLKALSVPLSPTSEEVEPRRPDLSAEYLADISASFENASPRKIIEWAFSTLGPDLGLAASMNDTVLLDLIYEVHPNVRVIFIDTGFHFTETLDTLERAKRRYPRARFESHKAEDHVVAAWKNDTEFCCRTNKVAPFESALKTGDGWLSGIRRSEAHTRNQAPIVARDGRGLIKVNPIANWSDGDVESYIGSRDLIVNPLLQQGYGSVGCWPCTRPLNEGESQRDGRWAGTKKVECGLHV